MYNSDVAHVAVNLGQKFGVLIQVLAYQLTCHFAYGYIYGKLSQAEVDSCTQCIYMYRALHNTYGQQYIQELLYPTC